MFSTTSARALLLGTVFLTLTLSPVFAGSGSDGPDIPNGTSSSETSSGDPGNTGHNGQAGGDGFNGGSVTSVVSGSNPNGVTATSSGGDGGVGGGPVSPFGGSDPNDPNCVEASPCEPATAGAAGGDGGDGGKGGDVDLTLSGQSGDNVRATSKGGDAGMPGDDINSQARGGNAGDVTVTIASTGAVTGKIIAESLGGDAMVDGNEGSGGDVTVTIKGSVSDSVTAKSDGGKISVVLNGGVVTGTITADSSNSDRSLTFRFGVENRTEFNAATQILTANNASGTVTINGHSYQWAGFSTLVNLLSYTGPEDSVAVVVKQPKQEKVETISTVGDAAPKEQPKDQPKAGQSKVEDKPKLVGDIPLIVGKPEAAKCSGGSEIRTVRQDDGSLVVIHRTKGADTLIGQLKDGEFKRTTGSPDWDIKVGDEGKSVLVTDATGNALSNCSFS